MSAGTRLRAAVIGVGAMGRNHARIYNMLEDVDLVAVADIQPAIAEQVARLYGLASYTDYRAMLAEVRPDLVSVVVPTQLHHPVVLDAIQAGAHVLVEKPIAQTVSQAQEMIAAARSAERVLAVGHVERFNPAIQELKRRLVAGELGRLFQVRARRVGPFPARISDVGVVIDLATHDVDVMRYLVNSRVVRVYAETARRVHSAHEDLLAGLLRFENGAVGLLDINWLTPTKIRELAVTGERGMFVINYLTQDLYFFENEYVASQWRNLEVLRGVGEGNMTRLKIQRREPLYAELEAFVTAVARGTPPVVTGEDGLAALHLAQQLVLSSQCGEVVGVEQNPAETVHFAPHRAREL